MGTQTAAVGVSTSIGAEDWENSEQVYKGYGNLAYVNGSRTLDDTYAPYGPPDMSLASNYYH